MPEQNFTASQMFRNANRFIEAYHAALQPVCRDTGLPPMAVDILMFFANNPESGTAKDVCQCRGFKSGIVSVHVDRLVNEGLLSRREVPGDRRKTRLVCTDAAAEIVERGRALQKAFAQKTGGRAVGGGCCRIPQLSGSNRRQHREHPQKRTFP